ncbi:DUF368 domain-containing protein [Kiritimatiellaeota bacterium B1221]|nr:DUF368 domain-containing protein [Kiritimatiellaeota bacterium B1221]
MNFLKDLFHGFAFGVANIIPGVSGGTLALVLGFYERLLGFLNRLNPTTLRELVQLKFRWLARPLDRERAGAFFGRLAKDDWGFMGRLLLGALVAIVGLARLMDYLLNEQFSLTYAFFFGLILLSIQVPWLMIRSKGIAVWINLILGIAITVSIAAAVNPYEKAKRKSDFYQAQTVELDQRITEITASASEAEKFSYTGKYSNAEFLMIFVAGMIAISAMVLPGISGSLLMILLGQYFIIIRALSSLISDWLLDDMLFLGFCALGMAVGLLLTARIVEVAMRKAYDATMAFLTGLIMGSLYALWPFKQIHVLDEYQRDGSVLEARNIASNLNQFPTQISTWLPVLALMALGALVMWGVMRMEEKEEA